MYHIINANAAYLVGQMKQRELEAYTWLITNLHTLNVEKDADYQRRYGGFWRLRFPPPSYRAAHYRLLERNKKRRSLTVQQVCQLLRPASKGLQFSFATKLVHLVNPDRPIYDEMVRQFFFLPKPAADADYGEKLKTYTASYGFLEDEYRKVLKDGLLNPAIREFRKRFPKMGHSDVKIIDWCIWEFVAQANGGGFLSGPFQHG